MFLISPPPSPPVGWEACYEDPPHPAPDLDLSAMNISSSPSNRRVTARNIQGVPSGIGSNPIAGAMRSSDEGQDARFQDNMSAAVGPGSSSNPTLDTMLLLTAFAHHCSQPGNALHLIRITTNKNCAQLNILLENCGLRQNYNNTIRKLHTRCRGTGMDSFPPCRIFISIALVISNY